MSGSGRPPIHAVNDGRQLLNPLPGIGGLRVTEDTSPEQNLEQRLYAEAAAARAVATRADIEATGIIPDVEDIVESLNQGLEPSPAGATIGSGTANKIYKRTTFSELDEDYKHRYPPQKDHTESDEEFEREWSAVITNLGVEDANPILLQESRRRARTSSRKIKAASAKLDRFYRNQKDPVMLEKFDLIGSLSTSTELIVEVCKHLPPEDILKLYSISRDFHDTIDAHMQSSIFAWIRHKAPESATIFVKGQYEMYLISDPAGRYRDESTSGIGYLTRLERPPPAVMDTDIRLVPSIRWLQMVCRREVRTRDIIATLARHGHRLLPNTSMTLKKLWLIMDIPTSSARAVTIRNRAFFSDKDLVRAQVFFTKLDMLFNDPLIGPGSSYLTRLMLGQRSLSTLWAFLRRKAYTSKLDIRQLKLRYDVGVTPDVLAYAQPVDGVSLHEMGVVHFEGWGVGGMHLLRPDELVPMEAARRQLELEMFARQFMMYGHVNISTGASLVPSLDELYMSDDELPETNEDISPINRGFGNVPFERGMWKPKHARKACWSTLTPEEKRLLFVEERREIDEEWGMDFAEAELVKATKELKNLVDPFFDERRKVAKRRAYMSQSEGEDGEVEEEYVENGSDGRGGDADHQMKDDQGLLAGPANSSDARVSMVAPEFVTSWLHSTSPGLSAGMEQYSQEKADDEDSGREEEEEGEEEEEEDDDEDLNFWEAGDVGQTGNLGAGRSSATSQQFSETPATLDDYLLAQADETYSDDDVAFDWDEHLHRLRQESDSPDEKAVDLAKSRGEFTLPVTLGGEGGNEDAREEWLRDYYRNW